MAKSRRPKNQAQAQFFDLALAHGFEITQRGWPTFFVEKDGKPVAVEVVSSAGRKLREDKRRVVAALQAKGIDCFIWSPNGGFQSLAESGSLTAASGGKGGEEVSSTSQGKGESEGEGVATAGLFDSPPSSPSRGSAEVTEQVDRIWASFVLHMKPTSTIAGEEERKIIRNALKVASEQECCEAIEGCRSSAYHMGDNPRGRKYNTISHILRGKRGKRTTREQIDMMIEIRSKAVASGGTVVSSVDPAVVAQRKDDVRRGFRLKGDPDAQRRAEAAEKWLTEQGIATQRREDGYPIWPSGGNA